MSCGGDSSGTDDGTASGTGALTSSGLGSTGPTTTGASATGSTTDPSGGSESNGVTTGTNPTTTTDATTTTATTSTTGEPGTSTTDPSTTSGVVPGTSTGEPGSSSGGGDGTTTTTGGGGSTTGGPPPVCEPGMGGGMGVIEKSYIWIASYDLNEISKVDTLTMTELARYKTGNISESPSRTAVSADGRFVVVNGRNSGRSTMFAANLDDCVDKNGNGQIDTSQNKANILAFGADECMIWQITHPTAGAGSPGPRGVTWTPGEWDYDQCKYVNPKVWIGYLAAGNVAKFVKVDGLTGTVEETMSAPNWIGSGYAPYGAALDPQLRPWFSSLRGEFVRVNTDEVPTTLTRITPPASVQSYGFTVDEDGNPWFGGCSGPVTVYDQKNQTFTPIVGTSACHRGVTADTNYVWVASNGPCGLVQVDRENRTLIAKHVPAQCSTAIGLSIDLEKYVWLVDQGGFAWKFKGNNVPAMQKILITGSHYVYSDMTGGQLLSVLPQ
jgi:hypothetical protein